MAEYAFGFSISRRQTGVVKAKDKREAMKKLRAAAQGEVPAGVEIRTDRLDHGARAERIVLNRVEDPA